MDERRRHHQEFARQIEVQLLQQVQILEVLLGDERDRNVVDVDLVLPDEMHEQIQRAFEGLQLDGDGVELRLERLVGRLRRWPECPAAHFIVAELHGVPHPFHRRRRLTLRLARPFDEHLAKIAGASQCLLTPFANRLQHGVERQRELGLDFDVADAPFAVARLQIVHLGRVRVECVVIEKHRIAFDRSRVCPRGSASGPCTSDAPSAAPSSHRPTGRWCCCSSCSSSGCRVPGSRGVGVSSVCGSTKVSP